MRRSPVVSFLTLAAFLLALTSPVAAEPTGPARAAAPAADASPLRASIDRAVLQAAGTWPVTPERRSPPARRAMMQGGGGGGGGMMLIGLISTVAGLAATYFIVKEMKKQNDDARTGQ